LPVLTVGGYFSSPDGVGPLNAGDVLTVGQTVYIYAQTGTVPNCFDQDSFTVTITTTPDVDDIGDVTACDSYTLPVLSLGNYFTATGGGGTPMFAGDVLTQGQTVYVYAESGTAPDTCSDEDTFLVSIGTTPSFTLDGGCQGSSFVITATVTGGSFNPDTAIYSWSAPGDGQIVGSTDGPSVTVSGAGDYTLMVTSGGCTSTSQVFNAPNTTCTIQKGISPNGDGYNDYFDLDGQDVTRLEIFNRYGTVVYKKADYSNQWYGQSDKGEELPDGTYYFVIDRNSGETKTGWIYINREN